MELDQFVETLTPRFAGVFGEEKARNVLNFYYDFRCMEIDPHFKSFADMDAGHWAQIIYFMVIAESDNYYQADEFDIPKSANWIVPDLADAVQYIHQNPSKRQILRIAIGRSYLRVEWNETYSLPSHGITPVPCKFEMGAAIEPVMVLQRDVLQNIIIQFK